MNAYLDSSVLLRLVLEEADRLRGWDRFDRRVGSDLAGVECLRTLDRLRLQGALSEREIILRRTTLFELMETTEVVELTRPILRRASEPFPATLGTLDALHLAAALSWRDEQGAELVMATHDRALARAARAYGMEVTGV